MANRVEEAIRIVLETQGREGVEALRVALAGVGDVSAETVADTDRLLDSITGLNEAAAKATRFEQMTAELEKTQEAFDLTSKTALQLALQIGAAEKPSRDLIKTQKETAREVDRLEASLTKQWEALIKADTELGKLGFNTADLAGAQKNLRSQIESGTAAIDEQARAVRKQAEANAQLKQRTAESDEQFRKLAKSGQVSAKALEDYRARTAAAAKDTDRLAVSAGSTTGVLDKLKTVAAAAFAFVSFRSVAAGIKSIVTEGSQAEQTLGQLEAVLASTNRQGEFTSASLLNLAETLSKVSKFTTDEIASAETRLLSYTNVAGKQFPEAMQVIIDQSARLGIGLEQSAEIIGKALQTPTKAMESLSKQGFILGADQKRLLEQLEATGQTAAAQAVIMDLLVESYGGAAAAQKLGTAAGLWSTLQKSFQDFQQQVSERGVLDFFKQQLADILDTGSRLAKDGTLSRWAQQTSDAIVGVARAIRGTTGFLVEHRGALVVLARAYAALKIAQVLIGLNSLRARLVIATTAALANAGAMNTATAATARFGLALRAIPAVAAVTIALIGVDVAIKGANALGEALAKNSSAAKNATELSERFRKQMLAEAQGRRELIGSLEEYAHQTVLTAQEVSSLGEAQRVAYKDGLAGLREYLLAQNSFFLRLEAANALTDTHAAAWDKVRKRLGEVNQGYADLAQGIGLAAAALTAKISPAAQKIIEQLGDIGRDGKLARESIASLFKDINLNDGNALGDVGLALAEIAVQSDLAGRSVREGLLASLQQLSGEELLRFQSSSAAAFEQFKKGPLEVAAILHTTLLAAMQKLGVGAEAMGLQFTQAGKDGTAAFATILENANATSAQIETAFKAALSKVATLEEARALGNLLENAGLQGKVGFDQAERAAGALRERLGEIQNAMSPLIDEFGRLGIKSKAELDRTRDAARDAFEAIREGAGRGKAAVEDVRAAFAKYAEAARGAVVNSDASAKARVEAELRVTAAILDSAGAFDLLGDAGDLALRKLKPPAAALGDALGGVSNAAASAASSVQSVGDQSEQSGKKLQDFSNVGKQFALSMYEVSDAALAATMSVNRLAGSPLFIKSLNNVTAQINAQGEALNKQVEALKAANAEFDELAGLRKELSQEFNLLGPGEIEKLVQARTQLEASQKRVEESKKREAERSKAAAKAAQTEAAAASAPAQATSGTAATPVFTAVLRLDFPDGGSLDVPTTREVAEGVVTRLHRARSTAIPRRP